MKAKPGFTTPVKCDVSERITLRYRGRGGGGEGGAPRVMRDIKSEQLNYVFPLEAFKASCIHCKL